jgi:tetratricopeptide (TPR) repeat protein
MNQFEKFDPNAYLLDSALLRLEKIKGNDQKLIAEFIRLYFLKKDYDKVIILIQKTGEPTILNSLKDITYDNTHAWTAYRIGESYFYSGKAPEALKFYKKATDLAKYNLDFQNKLATSFLSINNYKEAETVLLFILNENPKNVQAHVNYGFLQLLNNNSQEALKQYKTALSLDPDNEQALMNMAGLMINQNDLKSAKKYLKEVLKRYPKNERARFLLTSRELS